jgi:hypothetical protein
MKYDKSILALAVSAQYIFAGTQGGEILVEWTRRARELRILTPARSTALTRTNGGG